MLHNFFLFDLLLLCIRECNDVWLKMKKYKKNISKFIRIWDVYVLED